MIYLASLTKSIKAKVQGMAFILNKEELDIRVADNSSANKVIIATDFLEAYFTPSGLAKYIEQAKRINKNLIIEVEEKVNYSEDKMLRSISSCRNIEEVISLAVKYEKEFMATVKSFSDNRDESARELMVASSSVSQLQSIIDAKNDEIEELKHQLSIEQVNKAAISSRLSALVARINYQYGATIKGNSNRMFMTDSNSYDKCLYIKEITRVQHVDTLVKNLKEIFKVLYGMPTRIVVIEGYYSENKTSLYNMRPHYALKERDVLTGDILMLGFQPKLMNDIMKNPSRISILIILDRAGYDSLHIQANNMETYYTVSDLDDIKEYDVSDDRVISYTDKTLFIPYVEGFDKLNDSEKMQKYSSMGIVKKIVESLEK